MWKEGRQKSGYSTFQLLCLKFVDAWMIKYPPKVGIPEHVDKVTNKKHYRLNIVLSGKGTFFCEKTIFNVKNRVILFRPDKYKHSMINGDATRYVLSIGVAI